LTHSVVTFTASLLTQSDKKTTASKKMANISPGSVATRLLYRKIFTFITTLQVVKEFRELAISWQSCGQH